MHLSLSARVGLDEPTADDGFITWFDAEVVDEDGESVAARASAALIHVGSAGEALYDAMDADSCQLEGLWTTYLMADRPDDERGEDSLYSRLQGDMGHCLLYVHELHVEPAFLAMNLAFAVLRRLADVVGESAAVVVARAEDPVQAETLRLLGFEPGPQPFWHLRQVLLQPTVRRGDDGRFEVATLPPRMRFMNN